LVSAQALPAAQIMLRLKQIIGFGVLAYMAWFLVSLYSAHQQGSPPDAKFCSEWLNYYETFCKAYPSHCAEGPRKKARCDQGWDKR